ncbi:hypothetical protein [Nocardia abscessus]|uniref:hypothetical protein n=1 Tax=Nocardia abscessus TaxID=120957 RepID=UPI002455996B|nr:hypothetical protein [Nocardia abscessus]
MTVPHAKRLGYELAKTVVFGLETDSPLSRLMNVVRRVDVDAVIVSGVRHFGGEVPPELVKVVDVITVDSTKTYARGRQGAAAAGCSHRLSTTHGSGLLGR